MKLPNSVDIAVSLCNNCDNLKREPNKMTISFVNIVIVAIISIIVVLGLLINDSVSFVAKVADV